MIIVRIIGGLGNQMFQYAFYKSLKEKHENVKCDIRGYEKYKLHTGFDLENIFDIELDKASIADTKLVTSFYKTNIFSKLIRKIFGNRSSHIVEDDFEWNLINSNKDYYLDGYWQSEKYFGIQNELKKDFKFKTNLNDSPVPTEEIIKSCNSVSLHVRRGDYLGNNLYSQLDESYYSKAINLIQSQIIDPVFFVFSDDVTWVKENLIHRLTAKAKIVYPENKESSVQSDLKMMSLCKHNIVANSSFSWWGAWLNSNEEKIIVMPKKWYTNTEINEKHFNQMPENWIKI